LSPINVYRDGLIDRRRGLYSGPPSCEDEHLSSLVLLRRNASALTPARRTSLRTSTHFPFRFSSKTRAVTSGRGDRQRLGARPSGLHVSGADYSSVPLAGHAPFRAAAGAEAWLFGMDIQKNHDQTVALATRWQCSSFGSTIPVHSTPILKQSLSTATIADSTLLAHVKCRCSK
jgi:hypothetical protein